MAAGTVKFWRGKDHYGFITPDDGGPDVYMARASLIGCTTLTTGERVRFDLSESADKGKPVAARVELEIEP